MIKVILNTAIQERYGESIPAEISARVQKELEIIEANGWEADFLRACQITKQLRKANIPWIIPGMDGGSSLIAFLLGITQVNPLPPHYYCPKCRQVEFVEGARDGYDLPETTCSACGTTRRSDGHQIDISWFAASVFSPLLEYRIPACGISAIEKALPSHEAWTPLTKWNYVETPILEGWLLLPPEQCEDANWVDIENPSTSGEKIKALVYDYDLYHEYPRICALSITGLDLLNWLSKKTGIDAETILPNDSSVLRSLFTALGNEHLTETNLACTTMLCAPQSDEMPVHPKLRTQAAKEVPCFSNLVCFQGMYYTIIEGTEELPYHILKTFCDRDSALEFLIQYGASEREAFLLAQKIRKGLGYTKEVKAQLKSLHVDPQIIAAIEHIAYLLPRAHTVSSSMLYVRLAWFSLHYPEEYREALKQF